MTQILSLNGSVSVAYYQEKGYRTILSHSQLRNRLYLPQLRLVGFKKVNHLHDPPLKDTRLATADLLLKL